MTRPTSCIGPGPSATWTEPTTARAVLSARITANTAEYVAALPSDREQPAPALPVWIADRRALDSEHTAPEWREHLQERYDYLETRLEERGQAIAAQRPVWSVRAGRRPRRAGQAKQWTVLAAEVSVFREKYRVDEASPVAVPAELRERAVGADLASRVTALHKSSVLKDQVAGVDEPRSPAELLREQSRIRAQHNGDQLGLTGGVVPKARDHDRAAIQRAPSVPVRIVTETGRGQ